MQILDESHRCALQLKPAKFSWNFRLEDTNILAEIGRHAKPTPGEQVTATLSALNVYGPGGYFKQHKDAPVSGDKSFGTLVLGLPSQFRGELKTCSPKMGARPECTLPEVDDMRDPASQA